ncbi:MAG: DUF3108 domain-containing protein [Rhodoblastus sp.]|nr:DUF3108 domain-containing protein [Rhodoblastus sp.]
MILSRFGGAGAWSFGFVAALGAAACGLVAPRAAQAETLRATYALSIIGVPIGSADAAASIEASGYKVDIGLRLTGLAALVSKAKGAATANGAIANSAVLPNAYANTTANATETRTVRMGLNAGTVRAVDISPPFLDMHERVPVTQGHKSNVLDPVSALVMSVPAGQPLVGQTACDRIIPVYDGLVRFNVSLFYKGVRNVRAKGYSGPVSVCSARYTPISGYKLDSQSTRYMAENRDMEVWLAPVAQAHVVVPYYVKIGTKSGSLVIQAVDFHLAERRAQNN